MMMHRPLVGYIQWASHCFLYLGYGTCIRYLPIRTAGLSGSTRVPATQSTDLVSRPGSPAGWLNLHRPGALPPSATPPLAHSSGTRPSRPPGYTGYALVARSSSIPCVAFQ